MRRRYHKYLKLQTDKVKTLSEHWFRQYENQFGPALRGRIAKVGEEVDLLSPVLCLGARNGAEVRAFLAQGYFAVGIDLDPRDPDHVLKGDFHKTIFPTSSVETVYTNSLDHAFCAEQLMQEIRRVLVPGGTLMIDLPRGTEEGFIPDEYTTYTWKTTDQILELLSNSGFTLYSKFSFSVPWLGTCAIYIDGKGLS